MNCYQVLNNNVIAGLPVMYFSGFKRPHVQISEIVMWLTDELAETVVIGTRLMSCRIVRIDDGELWLIPPLLETNNKLVIYSLTGELDMRVESQINGPADSRILLSRQTFAGSSSSEFRYNETIVAILAPNSEVVVRQTMPIETSEPANWRGRLVRRGLEHKSTDLPFLSVNHQGQLSLANGSDAIYT